MPAYVALLRGIAPMHPKMRSAALRTVFDGLGFDHVRTVISSGNVVFETSERSATGLERRIEGAMHEHLDAPCSTIIRTRRQIEQLSELDVFVAFDDAPTDRCNVTFLKHDPSGVETPVVGPGAEIVTVRDRAVFSVVDTTATKTPDLMRKLEQAYGTEITTRTWRTVHRIVKVFAG